MGIWSSILEFYRRWKPQIDLYGVGFLLFTSALVTGRTKAALFILLLVLIAYAIRHWGEPYRQAGQEEMELRRRASQAYWEERFGHFFSRFHPTTTDVPEPAQEEPSNSVSRLIPRPSPDGEDPPESPGGSMLAEKPPAIIPPAVTHET